MVSKLLLTTCVQAHDNMLEVLRHINLYLSTRWPQNIGFSGHAGTRFFDIAYLQEFCLSRSRKKFQKSTKNNQKKSWGCAPHPLRTGLRPSHPQGQVPNVWPQWCLLTMTVYLANTKRSWDKQSESVNVRPEPLKESWGLLRRLC